MNPVIQWSGPDALRPLLMPIAELHEDPANVNVHDEESVKRIAGSYARFGQQKAVVADTKGVIRAGNGQLRAAIRLGWTHLAVVISDLSGVDLAAYALADNRTAQFSHLDDLKVAELCRSLQSEPDFPIEATGYTSAEIDALLGRLANSNPDPTGPKPDADAPPPTDSYTATIKLTRAQAYDEAFESDLSELCQRFGLKFTIQIGN